MNLHDAEEFRRIMSDVLEPRHDDHYLQRWLRARSWNVEAAEKMLRQSLKWRQQWEVDGALRTWEPPEAINLYFPSGTSGYDRDGCPVIVVPFGGLDLAGLLHVISRQDFIRRTIQLLELFMGLAAARGRHEMVVVFDMENFSLKQYAWRPAAEVVVGLLQMYESNYPEILKACYIVNAPRVFAVAFNLVKRFLNEYTLAKIQIYKSDPKKWKSVLLENIDADNLPKHFGGNLVDPDGNPRYTSKIHQGGKVPKTMYTKLDEDKNNATEYKKAVVRKGDKMILDFIVAEEGSFLRWDFRTEGHDIRFGITLKDDEGNVSPVVKYHRVAAHQIDEIGVIACQAPATYTVTFDNSYSFLRNKVLYYNVFIAPPMNEVNITTEEGEGSQVTGTEGANNNSTTMRVTTH